jgi:hypothetical protein
MDVIITLIINITTLGFGLIALGAGVFDLNSTFYIKQGGLQAMHGPKTDKSKEGFTLQTIYCHTTLSLLILGIVGLYPIASQAQTLSTKDKLV